MIAAEVEALAARLAALLAAAESRRRETAYSRAYAVGPGTGWDLPPEASQ